MSWFYRTFIRPALFAQDSEFIHERTMRMLGRASRSEVLCELLEFFLAAPPLPVELFGLKFPNPVGLAAGMDKQAEAVPAWASLGFGFTELGAVTWHPQPGNPRPRIFRAVPDDALINRMGFNNPGAEAVARRLAQWRARGRWPKHPVGINLGKSKITPLEKAPEDYANSFRALRAHADFFVVNVSSPNTPNLRELQDKAALDEILAAIQEVQSAGDAGGSAGGASSMPIRPILVKVAPDLSFEALDEILELAGPRRIAGLVATNTTIARPKTLDSTLAKIYAEPGGLSGRLLAKRSTEIIRHLWRQTQGKLPIIGVGGIFNAADAWEKLLAGASLVQVYTGLIYEGPSLVRDVVSGLTERLRSAGLKEIQDAVGRGNS
jgi:dihydroorotate dehydrogenase